MEGHYPYLNTEYAMNKMVEQYHKEEKVIKYNVEYFTNNRWNHYSGPHNNLNSAICNASVVSSCRKSNARILEDGVEKEEGNVDHWEAKLKEKAD